MFELKNVLPNNTFQCFPYSEEPEMSLMFFSLLCSALFFTSSSLPSGDVLHWSSHLQDSLETDALPAGEADPSPSRSVQEEARSGRGGQHLLVRGQNASLTFDFGGWEIGWRGLGFRG